MASLEKAGLKSIAEGRTDIHKVDPRKIHVKPNWNGRDFSDPENQAHVEWLAESIAKVGVKEPMTVWWENGKAWLSNGECRLRATMLAISRGAEIKTVPVMAEERHGNEADRLVSQIVRNSGKPFTAMEQANVYKRLLNMGWQVGDIATKSGVSSSRVSQVLGLLSMPEPIKQMVTSGHVSASLAQKTVAEAPTAKQAVQVLKDGIAVAKKQGKTRATQKHLNGGVKEDEHPIIEGVPFTPPDEEQDTKKRHRNLSIEKTVIEAFEYADVDDEAADDKGNPVVIITMPVKHWELIRQALKL